MLARLNHGVPCHRLLPLVAAVLLVDCGGAPSSPPALRFQVTRAEAGHLGRIRGELAFIRCGGPPDTLWAEDSPDGQADSALGALGASGEPIPALLRIVGGVITELRFAGPEGPDCDRLPAPADLSAQGNEPFWHLVVGGDSALITTPEQADRRQFGLGTWQRPDSTHWRFTAVAGDGRDTLSLELTATRCIDGMSGAWFPFVAEAGWAGRRVRGCAMEGKGAMGDR